jgi:hypothetical protein|tara:strand:- start:24613 stop:25188 length:576 start_codon:yes stop_codon:yes gene_type:complete
MENPYENEEENDYSGWASMEENAGMTSEPSIEEILSPEEIEYIQRVGSTPQGVEMIKTIASQEEGGSLEEEIDQNQKMSTRQIVKKVIRLASMAALIGILPALANGGHGGLAVDLGILGLSGMAAAGKYNEDMDEGYGDDNIVAKLEEKIANLEGELRDCGDTGQIMIKNGTGSLYENDTKNLESWKEINY